MRSKPKKYISSGQREIIAKLIFEKWPVYPTQVEIGKSLNITQSQVSQIMSGLKNKDIELPLKLVYTGRNTKLEDTIRSLYKIKDVSIIPSGDSVTNTEIYFEKIGSYAANLLFTKISEFVTDRRSSEDHASKIASEYNPQIKMSATAAGRSVLHTLKQLAILLKGSKINIQLENCVALRSRNIVSPSTLLFESFLGDKTNPNITVTDTYHLPPQSININKGTYQKIPDILNQWRILTNQLDFNNKFFKSDFAVFGLGNITARYTVSRFTQHMRYQNLEEIIDILDVEGEIACSPFNEKHGFLSSKLANNVFPKSNLPYNKEELIARLKKIAINAKAVEEKHVIQAIKLLCSMFTVDFNEIRTRRQRKEKMPYIMLVVGGKYKALPLTTLLKLWKLKERNVIDGIIIDEHTAIELINI